MKFEVDEKMVEPIVRDQIAAAVVSQLGNTDELIKRAVSLALKAKVDGNGHISKYNSDNRYDFVEAIASKAIREAAEAAIMNIVEEQKPNIQKAVEDQLKRAPKKTAAAIVNAFCESAGNSYKLTADFTIKPATNY